MTFRDLPSDIRHLPLTDPTLAADVVDLILGDEARAGGAIAFVLCDHAGRGLQPVVLSDVPDDADSQGMRQLLDHLLPIVAEAEGAVLIGRGRRGGLTPTDADREWHQLAISACAAHGVRLLGYYLASADGIAAMPDPLTAAS
jgi:hypothetical protein